MIDLMSHPPETVRGFRYARDYRITTQNAVPQMPLPSVNSLYDHFQNKKSGNGIWKWLHYFDIYDRHLKKFIGRPITALEVGVFRGGGLDMWREYFGDQAAVHGMDIDERCKKFEQENSRIFIGDQASKDFWTQFKSEIPQLDVLLDDGGHQPDQLITTLEEMLPAMSSGGVYIAEDLAGKFNDFHAYVHGLSMQLHGPKDKTWEKRSDGHFALRTEFQQDIASIHIYPFVVVIEKADRRELELQSIKRGSNF